MKNGALVGLPTETVYGLAADADQPQAVGRIFDAKGRPKDHPLIVHLAGASATQWRAGVEHYARGARVRLETDAGLLARSADP